MHSDERTAATAESFHADVSFIETPPKISILRFETLPPVGGDTLFISTEAAYDKLSPPLKQLAKSLKAVHSGIKSFGYRALLDRYHEYGIPAPTGDEILNHRGKYKLSVNIRDTELDAPLPVEHPVVRTHPITGRSALYINPTFTQVGLAPFMQLLSQAISP